MPQEKKNQKSISPNFNISGCQKLKLSRHHWITMTGKIIVADDLMLFSGYRTDYQHE